MVQLAPWRQPLEGPAVDDDVAERVFSGTACPLTRGGLERAGLVVLAFDRPLGDISAETAALDAVKDVLARLQPPDCRAADLAPAPAREVRVAQEHVLLAAEPGRPLATARLWPVAGASALRSHARFLTSRGRAGVATVRVTVVAGPWKAVLAAGVLQKQRSYRGRPPEQATILQREVKLAGLRLLVEEPWTQTQADRVLRALDPGTTPQPTLSKWVRWNLQLGPDAAARVARDLLEGKIEREARLRAAIGRSRRLERRLAVAEALAREPGPLSVERALRFLEQLDGPAAPPRTLLTFCPSHGEITTAWSGNEGLPKHLRARRVALLARGP